jgi:bacteriocin biosynthesis cyclodehydratase domain-containing protein
MLGDLPAHPRLADGLELVVGPGELLQLRGCIPPLRLTGSMPHALLPLLDGTRSLEAITAELNGWPPDEVLAAIRALFERGLITDVSAGGEPPTAPVGALPPATPAGGSLQAARAQAAFYWAATSGPADRGERTRQALRDARLHLFGWGGLLQELSGALRRCGTEGLATEGWLPPPGVLSAAGEGADPLLPFPTPAQLAARIPPRTAADLVMLALPRPAPALLAAANAASLSQGVPLLPVVLDGSEAVIGPTVLPGRSACCECFRQRLISNAAFPDDDAAYADHLDRPASGVTLPEWPPFTAAVASLAAMEAVRLATRFTEPLTVGQVLFLDALSGSHRISRVWKLPRCPACMRPRRAAGGGDADGQRRGAEP